MISTSSCFALLLVVSGSEVVVGVGELLSLLYVCILNVLSTSFTLFSLASNLIYFSFISLNSYQRTCMNTIWLPHGSPGPSNGTKAVNNMLILYLFDYGTEFMNMAGWEEVMVYIF